MKITKSKTVFQIQDRIPGELISNGFIMAMLLLIGINLALQDYITSNIAIIIPLGIILIAVAILMIFGKKIVTIDKQQAQITIQWHAIINLKSTAMTLDPTTSISMPQRSNLSMINLDFMISSNKPKRKVIINNQNSQTIEIFRSADEEKLQSLVRQIELFLENRR